MTTAGGFFTRWWEPEEEWFWRLENIAKLKTVFCVYWTSIKIKISMTCVLNEYEIKTKMVQEQWLQLKLTFLLFYWVELTFGGREERFGDEGVNEQIFGCWGDSPIIPVGKILHKLCQHVFIYNTEAPCTSHTLCAKFFILLLQDLIYLSI